jgi:hypothetical protein
LNNPAFLIGQISSYVIDQGLCLGCALVYPWNGMKNLTGRCWQDHEAASAKRHQDAVCAHLNVA